MDTDCSDGEKCYCSLKRIQKSGVPVYRINLDSDTDTTLTSLDEAKRLYTKPTKNLQNYARKTGSLTSWSALSRAESPLTAWRKNTADIQNPANPSSAHFQKTSAGSMRHKSLSSYLSDTSLDSDIVAMTEPAKKFASTAAARSSFAKQPEILRRKSRSSYQISETDLDSVTTSCNSFIRGTAHTNSRKDRPDSTGYQSYESTSSGKSSRNHGSENTSSVESRRNSISQSDQLRSSGRANKKVQTLFID